MMILCQIYKGSCIGGILYDLFIKPLNAWIFADLRAELLSQAQGKTLEVGVGTGLNLEFYPRQGIELIAIEPEASMRLRAAHRAQAFNGKILDANVENLPFPNDEFNTVVSTLVFCSVEHPELGLREIFRVLKSGGQFLIFEHVRKDSPFMGRVLDILNPFWVRLTGGCHLNRDPESLIEKTGFKKIKFRRLWHGLGKIWVLQKP